MDYNRLAVFSKVAELGSFSAAAQALGRTQPAISQQIALLEEELEFKLFQRVRGRVLLTPEGSQVYEAVQLSLGSLEEKVLSIQKRVDLAEGVIRCGVSVDQGNHYLIPKIVDFVKEYPKIQFQIFYGNSYEIEERIIENKLDMGLTAVVTNMGLIQPFEMVEEEYWLVAHPELLKEKGVKSPKDLLNLKLVDFNSDFPLLQSWALLNSSPLARTLVRRKPFFEIQNLAGMLEVVKRGVGVALLPKFLVESEVKAKRLKKVFPKLKDCFYPVSLVVQKQGTLKLYERLFVDFILKKSER